MKHAEQLAPLIELAMTTAGIVRQDLTAIAVGVGPGPFTGPAGRPGHRAHARRSCSTSPCTASARSTRSRSRPSTPARSTGDFVVATDARRKEVYLARYDAARRPARRPAGRQAGGPRDRRAGRRPGRRCSTPTRSRTGSARRRPSAGWLARVRGRGARRAERPRAALPAPPRRRGRARPQAGLVTVRAATADDVPAIADLELDNLGADAWSEGLVREGVARQPADDQLPGRRGRTARVVGHATASVVADIAELQRIAVDPAHRRTGLASELLDAVVAAGPRGRRRPAAARGARGQRRRDRVLRRPRLRRGRPAPPLLPRRRHGRGDAPRPRSLGCGGAVRAGSTSGALEDSCRPRCAVACTAEPDEVEVVAPYGGHARPGCPRRCRCGRGRR